MGRKPARGRRSRGCVCLIAQHNNGGGPEGEHAGLISVRRRRRRVMALRYRPTRQGTEHRM